MPTYGTLTTLDQYAGSGTMVAQIESDLSAAISNALAVHNGIMEDAISAFASLTDQQQLPYVTSGNMELDELDDNATPDTQKNAGVGSLGLPLRFYGVAVQWNRHWRLNTPAGALVSQLNSAADADVRNATRQIRRRLLTPTNTTGYLDKLQTGLTYDLQALLNADGMAIPPGLNGESFDPATHSHYTASASFTAAALSGLIDNVVEHGVSGGVRVYINRAQESAVRGFDGFVGYVDARTNPALTETTASTALDLTDPTDRAIGLFDGAEIWVRNAFAPANYQIAIDTGAPDARALVIRTRSGGMAGDAYQGGFGTLFEEDDHPLRATGLGREFGVGVRHREKAAVHFSSGGTYVVPTGL